MSTTQYDLKSVKLPRLAGAALRVFANLLESPATRGLLIGKLLRDGGITNIRALRIDEPPTFLPPTPIFNSAPVAPPDLAAFLKTSDRAVPGFSFATARDYADAYRAGSVTPEVVAQHALDAIAASEAQNLPLRAPQVHYRLLSDKAV